MVIIERAHYYAVLAERGFTIRESVLIEEDAITEVVRYQSLSFKIGKYAHSTVLSIIQQITDALENGSYMGVIMSEVLY